MVGLFERLERASALFVAEKYSAVIPLLGDILKEDPTNLDAVLRLATAYSSVGRESDALAAFARARALAPESEDVRLYLALHHARGKEWARAAPELERILAAAPDRLPALEALARIRERQGRIAETVTIRGKIYTLRDPTAAELVRHGEQAMSLQLTGTAIDAFERARTLDKRAFTHDLELGVLYLSARKLDRAREALDRVPADDPDHPMALFKRAQVSVLLNEPDATARIESARRHADSTTRTLIAREKLFTTVR
jgi:tetratricopeptide (TPR) repeat protein